MPPGKSLQSYRAIGAFLIRELGFPPIAAQALKTDERFNETRGAKSALSRLVSQAPVRGVCVVAIFAATGPRGNQR
jgi:hypothetical protein